MMAIYSVMKISELINVTPITVIVIVAVVIIFHLIAVKALRYPKINVLSNLSMKKMLFLLFSKPYEKNQIARSKNDQIFALIFYTVLFSVLYLNVNIIIFMFIIQMYGFCSFLQISMSEPSRPVLRHTTSSSLLLNNDHLI